MDLLGHVAVNNVSIKLNSGSTGLRFRLGADFGDHKDINCWADYGSAERVIADSDIPEGIGIVVQSGGVTLTDCEVNGLVKKSIELYEWANRQKPVVLRALSISGEGVMNCDQLVSSGGSVAKQPELIFQ